MNDVIRGRIQGLFCGLAIIALGGVFFFIIAPLFPKAIAASPARSMSVAEVKAELGEYDQRLGPEDCAALGAPGDWHGYLWIGVDTLTGQPTGVWFRCEP